MINKSGFDFLHVNWLLSDKLLISHLDNVCESFCKPNSLEKWLRKAFGEDDFYSEDRKKLMTVVHRQGSSVFEFLMKTTNYGNVTFVLDVY